MYLGCYGNLMPTSCVFDVILPITLFLIPIIIHIILYHSEDQLHGGLYNTSYPWHSLYWTTSEAATKLTQRIRHLVTKCCLEQ